MYRCQHNAQGRDRTRYRAAKTPHSQLRQQVPEGSQPARKTQTGLRAVKEQHIFDTVWFVEGHDQGGNQ